LPPEHCCAKNWSESSKAMEPMGIVDCAIQNWNSGKAWLRVFVSDDDSSSHAALKHSFQGKIRLKEPVDHKKGFRKASCLDIRANLFFGRPITLTLSLWKSSIQANKLVLSIQITRCRDFDLQLWIYNETKSM